jgi:Rrf2 family protein
MKLSTRGRYGLRALADLAMHDGGSPVTLAEIAQRQNISDGYLESIFSMLKKAGVVRSVKGAGGGYLLARPAADIYVGEVLTALEGDMSIIDTAPADSSCSLGQCIKENVWDVVSGRIKAVMDAVSLQQLVEQPKNIMPGAFAVPGLSDNERA